jgi:GTP-binding protein EngB required for normal cell division
MTHDLSENPATAGGRRENARWPGPTAPASSPPPASWTSCRHRAAEIAFVGRSNAGKSTAINTLAQQRALAFASKTPGRTQHINLFEVGPAEAPDASGPTCRATATRRWRAAKLRWQQVMADYLAHRRNLAGVVLMVDSAMASPNSTASCCSSSRRAWHRRGASCWCC